jgi:cell division protein FtsQ
VRNFSIVFVLLVLFFAGVWMFLINFPWFNLRVINISGDSDLTLNEVTRLSPIFLGTNILRIDTRKVENDIKKNLTLSQVKVKRRFPDKIEIKLQRKSPIFLINLDQLYGLTQNKEIIPLKGFGSMLDLPILSGVYLGCINFYREVDIPEIQRAIEFYHATLDVDSTFLSKISELDLSFSDNLVLHLLPSGLRIMMGSEDYRRKIARLMAILEVESKLEQISWVDLRFENQGIVKNKKL